MKEKLNELQDETLKTEKEVKNKELSLDEILKSQKKDNDIVFTLFLILLTFGFNSNPTNEIINRPLVFSRKDIVAQVNQSDLSNSEKKRIIEILLG